MKASVTKVLLVASCLLEVVSAFQTTGPFHLESKRQERTLLGSFSRREWAASVAATLALQPLGSSAEDLTALEMKQFVDPQGLFILSVPKSFYTLRRTQKGDLPDAKTGKGRRGSSIFTAGDMAKAEASSFLVGYVSLSFSAACQR